MLFTYIRTARIMSYEPCIYADIKALLSDINAKRYAHPGEIECCAYKPPMPMRYQEKAL